MKITRFLQRLAPHKYMIFAALFICIYAFFMFIDPFVTGGHTLLIDTLLAWQTLNAGFFAFLASVIVYMSQRQTDKQRRKDSFIAERAFLPKAYSSVLSSYKDLLKVIWHYYLFQKENKYNITKNFVGDDDTGIGGNIPMEEFKVGWQCKVTERDLMIMKGVICYAEPFMQSYISRIINLVQISEARFDGILAKQNYINTEHFHKELKSFIVLIVYICAMVWNSFEWARGASTQVCNSPDPDDLMSVYRQILGQVEAECPSMGTDTVFSESSMSQFFEKHCAGVENAGGYKQPLQCDVSAVP